MIAHGGNRCTTRVLASAGSSVPKMQQAEPFLHRRQQIRLAKHMVTPFLSPRDTESKLFLKLSQPDIFAKYFCKRAKCSLRNNSSYTCGPVPSANLPRSFWWYSSQRVRNRRMAASATVKCSPTANCAPGWSKSCISATALSNVSDACGSPRANSAKCCGKSLVEKASMKKRTCAR